MAAHLTIRDWVRVLVVACLVVATTVLILWAAGPLRHHRYNPLNYDPSPQHITSSRSIFTPGMLSVEAVKCLNGSKPTPVNGVSYWKRLSPTTVTLLNRSGFGVFNPAEADADNCLHLSFDNPVPVLEPGVWRIEGQDCAQQGSETDCSPWYTETFTVRRK